MTVSVSTFRVQYPEFSSAPDPFIQVFLDMADLSIDRGVWGLKGDMGQGLYAAHLLSIAPNGQYSRLQTEKGTTTYLAQYNALIKEVACGIRIF